MGRKLSKPESRKPSDEERHKRFLEMAKEVGASEDPKDLDRALKAVTKRPGSGG